MGFFKHYQVKTFGYCLSNNTLGKSIDAEKNRAKLTILLEPDYLTQHFEIIIKKNKLKKIRYHDLRHSCASLLLANGVSLKEIQDWLGHSDYSTTANIYSHLEYGAKLKSAGKISETLNIKREKKDGK